MIIRIYWSPCRPCWGVRCTNDCAGPSSCTTWTATEGSVAANWAKSSWPFTSLWEGDHISLRTIARRGIRWGNLYYIKTRQFLSLLSTNWLE